MRGRCPICGFDADTLSVNDAIVALRSFPRRWRAATARPDGEPDAILRRRPAPDVWSALEYAAHVRDIFALHGWGMYRTLTEDHAVFDWPDGVTEESIAAGYAALDPATVVDELSANAERVAARAERTDAGDWRRPATLPGDEKVDALWFLHHCVHEGSHHLRDVHHVLQQVRGRSTFGP